MAEDRDERRRDDTIEGAQREYIVTEHSEGVAPADARRDPPRDDREPDDRPRDEDGRDESEEEGKAADSGGSVSVMTMIITGALALIFGLVGAWAYNAFLGGSPEQGKQQASEGQGEGRGASEQAATASTGAGGREGTSKEGIESSTVPAGEQSGTYGARRTAGLDADEGGAVDRLDRLAEEVAHLRELIESRPDPASAGQAEQMKERLDDLSNRLESVESMAQSIQGLSQLLRQRSERMDAMSDMIDEMESQLTTMADRLGTAMRMMGVSGEGSMLGIGGASGMLGGDSTSMGSPPSPTGEGTDGGGVGGPGASIGEDPAGDSSGRSEVLRRVVRPNPDDSPDGEPTALERGILQFGADDFEAARDTFFELLERRPSDARIWYYAALANGKATGDWKGETERLVLQGVERERAGTPPKIAIDAAFSDLSERQGAEWLRYYRRRAGG